MTNMTPCNIILAEGLTNGTTLCPGGLRHYDRRDFARVSDMGADSTQNMRTHLGSESFSRKNGISPLRGKTLFEKLHFILDPLGSSDEENNNLLVSLFSVRFRDGGMSISRGRAGIRLPRRRSLSENRNRTFNFSRRSWSAQKRYKSRTGRLQSLRGSSIRCAEMEREERFVCGFGLTSTLRNRFLSLSHTGEANLR